MLEIMEDTKIWIRHSPCPQGAYNLVEEVRYKACRVLLLGAKKKKIICYQIEVSSALHLTFFMTLKSSYFRSLFLNEIKCHRLHI